MYIFFRQCYCTLARLQYSVNSFLCTRKQKNIFGSRYCNIHCIAVVWNRTHNISESCFVWGLKEILFKYRFLLWVLSFSYFALSLGWPAILPLLQILLSNLQSLPPSFLPSFSPIHPMTSLARLPGCSTNDAYVGQLLWLCFPNPNPGSAPKLLV